MYIDTTEMKYKGGYREKYAVDKFLEGEASIKVVHDDPYCLKFIFDTDKESASNGSTYCLSEKRWVN